LDAIASIWQESCKKVAEQQMIVTKLKPLLSQHRKSEDSPDKNYSRDLILKRRSRSQAQNVPEICIPK
jgi:hypothetical protein